MDTMRIPLDIPSDTFWAIAEVAETHDMKVPEYLVELAMVSLAEKRDIGTDPVVTRWRWGFTDAQIAHELGWTNMQVSVRRRSFGLPANKRTTKGNKE